MLVLLAALPAIALSLFTGLEERRQAALNAQEDALRTARLAALNQQSLINGTEQVLITLTQLEDIRQGNSATCNMLLAQLNRKYPQYTALAVAQSNGDVICSSLSTNEGFNIAGREFFQQVLNKKGFVIGSFEIGSLTKRPVLPLAYPAFNADGQVDRVVVASLALDWLNNLGPTIPLPDGASLLLVDSKGTILARYPNSGEWVGKSIPEAPLIQRIISNPGEGTIQVAGLDGVNRLNAFTPVAVGSQQDVFVNVGIPTSVAFAEVDRQLIRNLIGLVLVTLLALLAAWVFGDLFFLRQLKSLSFATHKLRSGDLSARSGINRDETELGNLGEAFDQMAQTIQQRAIQLRRAESRYRSLVEQIPAIIYTSSPKGASGMMYISPQIEDILGFEPQEWIADSQVFWRQIHPQDRERVDEGLQQAWQTGESFRSEYRLFAKNGRLVWVRDESVLVRDEEGNDLFRQGIMIDITERKRAEAALKNYATQLERSNRELQDFAYISSHDLQEPLRKIQAFGERLGSKYADILDERGQDYLERMIKSAARMQNLINDLLAYSRVTTKANPFEEVSLTEVAKEVVNNLQLRLEETGGRVEIEALPEIQADELQMQQLFQNLISNALKFHKEDVKPSVRIYPEESGGSNSDGMVQIHVTDNGIGFEEQYLEKIFQPFQRLHSREEFPGSGIGLAICRKIVERHGGTLVAHSEPGEGSDFVITLPVHHNQPEKQP